MGSTVTPLWSSDEVLSNHYATSVYSAGVLYGYHGRQEYGPSLRAVDFKSGQVKWSQDKFGAGTVTLAGDQLVVMREDGEFVLAPATPSGFKPTARARVLQGTVRAYPALDAGFSTSATTTRSSASICGGADDALRPPHARQEPLHEVMRSGEKKYFLLNSWSSC